MILTVIDGDVIESKSMAAVDGESVHWRANDGQTSDGSAHLAESDKLGLIDASVAALAVPVELLYGGSKYKVEIRVKEIMYYRMNDAKEGLKILTGPLPSKVPLVPSTLMLVPPMVTRSLSLSRVPLAKVMVPANVKG